MKAARIGSVIGLVGLLVATTACDDTLFLVGGGGDTGPISDDPYEAVQGIMEASCVGCHGSGGTSPELDGDFRANVIDVVGSYDEILVVAGDAEASFLYRKVTGELTGDEGGRMPYGGELTAAEQGVIADWINAGAPASASGSDTETGATDTEPTDTASPQPVWADVQELFDASCVGCHGSGGTPPELTSAVAYDNLVGITSDVYGVLLVDPGDPDNSLLWRKLAGTQGSDEGVVMPYDAKLPLADVQHVSDWITLGAKP